MTSGFPTDKRETHGKLSGGNGLRIGPMMSLWMPLSVIISPILIEQSVVPKMQILR